MRAIDLFCGAGGASRGLHDAGYDVTGYDHWQPAVECHNANGLAAHLHDLSDDARDALIPWAPLWWASPPCQPFSAAGAQEGEFDGRDGFPWLLRLVAQRLPDVLITENVKGLTFRKHSAYFAGILDALRGLGYDVAWRVLNTADLGVPQTRERTIIVARRDGGPITWPAPTHCRTGGMFTRPWVTMAQALGWGMNRPSSTVLSGGTETGGAEHFTPAARRVMRAGTAENATVRRMDEPAPTIKIGHDAAGHVWLHYRQNDPAGRPIVNDVTDKPSPAVTTQAQSQWLLEVAPTWPHERPATTISTDVRVSAPGHHDPAVSNSQMKDAIRLTIPELAALQGFPADWTWTGTKTQQARMVGNAVPPALARALAAANRPTRMEAAA